MKKYVLIGVVLLAAGSFIYSAHAKKGPSDAGMPVVAKFVCSDLCSRSDTIYVYEGVTDPAQCARMGGEMYSHHGWGLVLVCKMMNKARCAAEGGRMGEFHFPLQAKNYLHMGCAETMTPEECRAALRERYLTKDTENKYFMNNIGCVAH